MSRKFVLILIFVSVLALSVSAFAQNRLSKINSWLCFYSGQLPPLMTGKGTLSSYDLYIFDSRVHPDLKPLRNAGGLTVGYVSLGEINEESPNFQTARLEKLLVDENKNWPGSHRVDIANPKWHDLVINKMIPKTLAEGFDGIFIDTIDTAVYLQNEKKMDGEIAGAVTLLREVRKKYPNMIIVLNGGLFLTNEVGNIIDALVIEDVFTQYDFKKKRYKIAPPDWTNERIISLKEFQKKFAKPVLALDYLRSTDKKNIEIVSKSLQKEGFLPYISEINLDKIFFHP